MAAAVAAHADAKGWIVDLRGNGGGRCDLALRKRLSRPAVYNAHGRTAGAAPG